MNSAALGERSDGFSGTTSTITESTGICRGIGGGNSVRNGSWRGTWRRDMRLLNPAGIEAFGRNGGMMEGDASFNSEKFVAGERQLDAAASSCCSVDGIDSLFATSRSLF